jgi:hypothetical protein
VKPQRQETKPRYAAQRLAKCATTNCLGRYSTEAVSVETPTAVQPIVPPQPAAAAPAPVHEVKDTGLHIAAEAQAAPAVSAGHAAQRAADIQRAATAQAKKVIMSRQTRPNDAVTPRFSGHHQGGAGRNGGCTHRASCPEGPETCVLCGGSPASPSLAIAEHSGCRAAQGQGR